MLLWLSLTTIEQFLVKISAAQPAHSLYLALMCKLLNHLVFFLDCIFINLISGRVLALMFSNFRFALPRHGYIFLIVFSRFFTFCAGSCPGIPVAEIPKFLPFGRLNTFFLFIYFFHKLPIF